jgi:hypothetical protein
MNRLNAAAVCFLVGLAWALLQGEIRAQPDPAGQPPPTEGQDLQRPAGTELRDPFWPIGWRPPGFGNSAQPAQKLNGQVKWDEARRQLEITGLSKKPDGSYLAIIKGAGVVEKGDVVSVRCDSLVYRWRIVDITGEGIIPEQLTVSKE